jgi:hypothetical protein
VQSCPAAPGDGGVTTAAHAASGHLVGPPSVGAVYSARSPPARAADPAGPRARGSGGPHIELRRPRPPAPAGSAGAMAHACRPEHVAALPALRPRAPGGHRGCPSGGHAAVASGPDRRPDHSPEAAEASAGWPGPPRSPGPAVLTGGVISRESSRAGPVLSLLCPGAWTLHPASPRLAKSLKSSKSV